MVTDGGAPHCRGCRQPLQFGTDRQGRTTESCACGYRGFVQTRPGQLDPGPDEPGHLRRATSATRLMMSNLITSFGLRSWIRCRLAATANCAVDALMMR